MDEDKWMLLGGSLQSIGAITEKSLSPIQEELERGEIRERGG